jgi:hypothetical protein
LWLRWCRTLVSASTPRGRPVGNSSAIRPSVQAQRLAEPTRPHQESLGGEAGSRPAWRRSGRPDALGRTKTPVEGNAFDRGWLVRAGGGCCSSDGCGPMWTRHARPRRQRRTASRTLLKQGRPLPAAPDKRAPARAIALLGGALAGSGPGTSPCIDGLSLIRHIHGMRSSWSSEGRPGYGASEVDRGCPLGTGVVRLMWHAGGTTDSQLRPGPVRSPGGRRSVRQAVMSLDTVVDHSDPCPS